MVQIWDYRQTWYIHFYQIINNFQLFKNTVRNFINSESKIVYQVEAQTIERIQNIIRRYVISHFEGTAAEILTRMNESHRSCGASKVGFFVSIKLSKNSELGDLSKLSTKTKPRIWPVARNPWILRGKLVTCQKTAITIWLGVRSNIWRQNKTNSVKHASFGGKHHTEWQPTKVTCTLNLKPITSRVTWNKKLHNTQPLSAYKNWDQFTVPSISELRCLKTLINSTISEQLLKLVHALTLNYSYYGENNDSGYENGSSTQSDCHDEPTWRPWSWNMTVVNKLMTLL